MPEIIYRSASSAAASGLYLYPPPHTARSGRCQQCAHTHTARHSSSSSSNVFCMVMTMTKISGPPPRLRRVAYTCIHPRSTPAPKAQQCAHTHTAPRDTVAAVSAMRFVGLYHYHNLPVHLLGRAASGLYVCTHPHVQHARAAVSSALTRTQRRHSSSSSSSVFCK